MITHNARTSVRITVLDLAVASLVVVLLLTLALGPALARLQRSSQEAQCQSNLHRWSEAISLYCSDNHGWYPTNRGVYGTSVGVITNSQQLVPDGSNVAGNLTWVEALYPYVQKSANRTGQDWKSFRACPKASLSTPEPVPMRPTAYMTYAFNYNLVERPKAAARAPGTLMMLREMDWHVNAVLRPSNLSSDVYLVPQNAFLNGLDGYSPYIRPQDRLHDAGSYIAFADGHVRYFTLDYYARTPEYDSVDKRWYNYVNSGSPDVAKTIAITP